VANWCAAHVLRRSVQRTAQYRNVFDALHVAQQSIRVALVASFLVAAAVIALAVLLLVPERTAEIAILKTIGASHWQVVKQFWLEILAMSAMAATLAVLLLALLRPFIAEKFDIDASSMVSNTPPAGAIFMQTVGGPGVTTASNPLNHVHLAAAPLNPQTLLIIVGVGIGPALLTSLIPTWFVSHIKPAIVLRGA
jgi:putative ABC transport system permease protein